MINFVEDPINFYLNPLTWIGIIFLIFFQFLILVYAVYRGINNERKIQFFPEYLGVKNDPRLGKYTPEKLQEMVKDLISTTGHHVKRGYIGVEIIPKMISHYIPSQENWLYLNSNLLQIAGEEEVKAALAIEFKNFNSLNNTLVTFLNFHSRAFLSLLFLRLFYPLILTFLFILLPEIENEGYEGTLSNISTLGFVFITILIIAFFLWQFMNFLIKSAYLNSYYISDEEAAKLVGKNNTINMLVKLGQRSEALDVLLEEIKWLEEKRIGKIYEFDEEKLKEILKLFPPTEISEHIARESAPEIFLRNKFSQLTDNYYVDIPELENIIKSASKKLLEERKNYIEERKVKLEEMGKKLPHEDTIDWRQFDVDGNLHLDDKELELFVKELKTTKKLLFENELVGDAFFKRKPPINKRILRLWKLKIESEK